MTCNRGCAVAASWSVGFGVLFILWISLNAGLDKTRPGQYRDPMTVVSVRNTDGTHSFYTETGEERRFMLTGYAGPQINAADCKPWNDCIRLGMRVNITSEGNALGLVWHEYQLWRDTIEEDLQADRSAPPILGEFVAYGSHPPKYRFTFQHLEKPADTVAVVGNFVALNLVLVPALILCVFMMIRNGVFPCRLCRRCDKTRYSSI